MQDNSLKYNGMPLFMVDFDDFGYIAECVTSSKRLLARNIKCESLKEYFINTRKPIFAVSYSEVIISYGR